MAADRKYFIVQNASDKAEILQEWSLHAQVTLTHGGANKSNREFEYQRGNITFSCKPPNHQPPQQSDSGYWSNNNDKEYRTSSLPTRRSYQSYDRKCPNTTCKFTVDCKHNNYFPHHTLTLTTTDSRHLGVDHQHQRQHFSNEHRRYSVDNTNNGQCEICSGIDSHSPTTRRRNQQYTSHFCTRIPEKKKISKDVSIQTSFKNIPDIVNIKINETNVDDKTATNENDKSNIKVIDIKNELKNIHTEKSFSIKTKNGKISAINDDTKTKNIIESNDIKNSEVNIEDKEINEKKGDFKTKVKNENLKTDRTKKIVKCITVNAINIDEIDTKNDNNTNEDIDKPIEKNKNVINNKIEFKENGIVDKNIKIKPKLTSSSSSSFNIKKEQLETKDDDKDISKTTTKEIIIQTTDSNSRKSVESSTSSSSDSTSCNTVLEKAPPPLSSPSRAAPSAPSPSRVQKCRSEIPCPLTKQKRQTLSSTSLRKSQNMLIHTKSNSSQKCSNMLSPRALRRTPNTSFHLNQELMTDEKTHDKDSDIQTEPKAIIDKIIESKSKTKVNDIESKIDKSISKVIEIDKFNRQISKDSTFSKIPSSRWGTAGTSIDSVPSHSNSNASIMSIDSLNSASFCSGSSSSLCHSDTNSSIESDSSTISCSNSCSSMASDTSTSTLEDASVSRSNSFEYADSFEYDNSFDKLRIEEKEKTWNKKSLSSSKDQIRHQKFNEYLKKRSTTSPFPSWKESSKVSISSISSYFSESSSSSSSSSSVSDDDGSMSELGWSFASKCNNPTRLNSLNSVASTFFEKSNSARKLNSEKSDTSLNMGNKKVDDFLRMLEPPKKIDIFHVSTPQKVVVPIRKLGPQKVDSLDSGSYSDTSQRSTGSKISIGKRESSVPKQIGSNSSFGKAKKFGLVVNSLKKPGHHIGPSKNPECSCETCVNYFNEQNRTKNKTKKTESFDSDCSSGLDCDSTYEV